MSWIRILFTRFFRSIELFFYVLTREPPDRSTIVGWHTQRRPHGQWINPLNPYFDLIWRIHSESGFFLHLLLNFSILDSRITSDGQKSWDFLFPSKSLAALNTDDWVSPYPPWPTDYKPLTFIDPCSSKQKIHPAITSPPPPHKYKLPWACILKWYRLFTTLEA